jgi:putative spermidine/putrescine transport system ATP-binding protein
MPIVRLEGINKHYGSVTALSTIDLHVHEGEFLTLLGPSGSGKTTILNLIAGMVRPSTGRIFLRDIDVTDLPASQRQLGMVFQNYALMPHMTIFENVAFPLRVRRVPGAEIRRRVTEVLDIVQLPNVAGRKPRELSGGQQQRVAIARAMVYNPSIILMDEPLGALDRKLREQLQLEIKRLHERLGITMLYVTHDQEEALVMSDRICLMNHGRIEQLDVPKQLYFRPASVFAAQFLGESNILSGTVTAAHPVATVRGVDGNLLRAAVPSPVNAGAELHMLVRPETIAVLEAGEPATNQLHGIVGEVVFVGSMTRYLIRLPDGTDLIVKQAAGSRFSLNVGEPVRIGWSAEDCIPLPGPDAVTPP